MTMVAVYPILSLLVIFAASLLILIARSRWLNRALTPLIERSLQLATGLDVRDYTRVLGLQRDYRVAEVDVATDG